MPPRDAVDKELKRSILDTRHMLEQLEKADGNESETRRRVERMFESLMGYDAFLHLSRERAVKGAGENEYVDFEIRIEDGKDFKPYIFVEIKRIAIDLAPKHLRQVSSYAINAGCEWILLTNGKEWRLYHVSFGQPPATKHIVTCNLFTDELRKIADFFDLISYRSVRRGVLEEVWRKTNVLLPQNMLSAILSEDALKVIRREIRKNSGVFISPEDIVSGVRRLLNESALAEMENIKICLPQKKKERVRRPRKEREAVIDNSEPENIDVIPITDLAEEAKLQG